MARTSVSPQHMQCLRLERLLFNAPWRQPRAAASGAAFGLAFGLGIIGTSAAVYSCLTGVVCSLIGCWMWPWSIAVCSACSDFQSSSVRWMDHFMTALLPSSPSFFAPQDLRYSLETVGLEAVPGVLIYEPLPAYTVSAFVCDGELAVIDNAALFSAKENNIARIEVYFSHPVEHDTTSPEYKLQREIKVQCSDADFAVAQNFDFFLQKLALGVNADGELLHATFAECFSQLSKQTLQSLRADFLRMHKFSQFVLSIQGQREQAESGCILHALVLTADMFPSNEQRPNGHVVLEADKIISTRRGSGETLTGLIKARCPNLDVVQPGGDRFYARVRGRISDESVLRAIIKAVARERGKRTNIKVIERLFDSPRD